MICNNRFTHPGIDQLCVYFAAHVKARGLSLIEDTDKDKSMVQELLDFKNKLDNIIKVAYGNNNKFVNAMRESFEGT